MSKVTVVGAGNVGATCANVLVTCGIADEVVLLDIKEGVSEGKAMDIMQTASILNLNTRLTGVTNDYSATEGSDVVVITSGIPRKPGMTREELIGVNAGIVKSVTEQLLKHSPNAVIICISNPMDTMTYLIHKISGLPKNRIIGMGGALDSARFKYFLANALGANRTEVEGIVIGGHGDTTMIPLVRYAAYRGVPPPTTLTLPHLRKLLPTLWWAVLPSPNFSAPLHGTLQVRQEPKWYRLCSTTSRSSSHAPLFLRVSTAKATSASVFPPSSARTVSRESSSSNSTRRRRLSSTRAQRLYTRPTRLSKDAAKLRYA